MSASGRAAAFILAAGFAFGALAWGLESTDGPPAGWGGTPGSPEARTLALIWERTYCPDCDAPAEPSASEARARARPPR